MNILKEYLGRCADDVRERYNKALKIIGKSDFTYSKVELDNFDEVKNMAVISGFDSLPKKYQDEPELQNLLKYGIVPYALIEQDDLLNWLVVKSNADFEMRDTARVDELTLPYRVSEDEFWADAYVLNLRHLDYGYDNGGINIVAEKHGFIRIK